MTDTEEMLEYNPSTLLNFADEVRKFRIKMLCEISDAGADTESEQWFLMALSTMDQAYHQLTMAALKQSQGIAAIQRGGLK